MAFVFIGAVAAVGMESMYRVHGGTFDQILLLTIPLALIVNYGVFRTMQANDSMFTGIIMWSTCTVILRLISTLFIIKEQPHPGAWAGFVLIVLAQFVSK